VGKLWKSCRKVILLVEKLWKSCGKAVAKLWITKIIVFNKLFNRMKLLHGNCLELLPQLEPNSIDLVFCDLPYGQTYCKWDNKIDLSEMWKEVKRVIKPTTPIFFTCSTKFGYELIKSNEKWFRSDLVWEKSSPCGFLNAKQMPMRKHEMVYVFF